MDTVSAPKGAGKGNPRPKKDRKPRKRPQLRGKDFTVGELVSLAWSPDLCQVVSIDGNALIVHRMMNFDTDEGYPPSERTAVNAHECWKIPSLILPASYPQMRTKEKPYTGGDHLTDDQVKTMRWRFLRAVTKKALIEEISERHRYQGDAPPAVKLLHQKMFARVIAQFEVMHSLWHDLALGVDADGYTIAWHDNVAVAWLATAIDQARAELYAVFTSLSGSIGVDLTHDERIENYEKLIAGVIATDAIADRSAESNAEAAYRNVMKFVTEVKVLQRRAWLYSQSFESNVADKDMVVPFEHVIEAAMGKVASIYLHPIAPEQIDASEVAASEILAGTRDEVTPRTLQTREDVAALSETPEGKQ